MNKISQAQVTQFYMTLQAIIQYNQKPVDFKLIKSLGKLYNIPENQCLQLMKKFYREQKQVDISQTQTKQVNQVTGAILQQNYVYKQFSKITKTQLNNWEKVDIDSIIKTTGQKGGIDAFIKLIESGEQITRQKLTNIQAKIKDQMKIYLKSIMENTQLK